MGQFEQLDQLLETQDGMLRTAQVVSAGISKPVFYDYVHSRELERVAHGIYLSKDDEVKAVRDQAGQAVRRDLRRAHKDDSHASSSSSAISSSVSM